jgi:2-polyprenyl-3-methyl-5-hydroxy-6-metoxy-1,4-benzoquinol methylase
MRNNNLTEWNNKMFMQHPTPYNGFAGFIEKNRVNAIIKEINKYKKNRYFSLLEIGCEAGNLLEILSNKFPKARLFGYDISQVALKKAKNKLDKKIKLKYKDLTNDNFSTDIDKTNFIICSEVLEHIPNVSKAINNISKISSLNQFIIITVPYEKIKNSIKNILTKLKIFNFLFKGIESTFSEWHVHNFSENDIKRLFKDNFIIIKYRKIFLLHQLLVLKKKNN